MISQLPPAVLVHACARKHVYINMMHSSRRVSEPCSQDSVCVNSESLLQQDIPTLRAPPCYTMGGRDGDHRCAVYARLTEV